MILGAALEPGRGLSLFKIALESIQTVQTQKTADHKKVVLYLINQPLDSRNRRRFGVDSWDQADWHLEIWDLTCLQYPAVRNDFDRRAGVLDTAGLKYYSVDSWIGLWHLIRESRQNWPPDGFFFDMLGNEISSSVLRVVLKRNCLKRVIAISGLLPEVEHQATRFAIERLVRLVRGKIGLVRLWQYAASFLIGPAVAPDIVIVPGAESTYYKVPEAARRFRLIKAHSLDYDRYLELTSYGDSRGREADAKYAVFLDEDACFHPDFLYLKRSPPVTATRYYPALVEFFDRLVAECGLNIIVAAHPRARYSGEQKKKYFKSYQVVEGATLELIRDSSLVMCHSSTSIGMAVMCSKPLLFLTTDELNATSYGQLIARFADLLGKDVINIDKRCEVGFTNLFEFDLGKYGRYMHSYIKSPGSPPDGSYWDTVRRSLL